MRNIFVKHYLLIYLLKSLIKLTNHIFTLINLSKTNKYQLYTSRDEKEFSYLKYITVVLI